MDEFVNRSTDGVSKPRYRWPWFVLAAVLLAVLLAFLWMSREVERTRRLREWNSAPATPAAGNPANGSNP